MPIYRFFISYQHEDIEIARKIESFLKDQGHYSYRDETNLVPGTDITPAITKAISRSHFLLLLGTNGKLWNHAWVQQEIGFALASSVKVIVIFVSKNKTIKPHGMIDGNATIKIEQSDDIDEILKKVNWEVILANSRISGSAVFHYINKATERPKLIAEVAHEIKTTISNQVTLRIRSGMSTFSLPKSEQDENWMGIDTKQCGTWFHIPERVNVQNLAGKCYLIIDPNYPENPDGRNPRIQIAKLTTLRKFLSESDDNVEVVRKKYSHGEGLIIFGNHWFLQSAAVGPTDSVRSALYTWHAATIDEYCALFDDEFLRLKKEQEDAWLSAGLNSRSYAIVRIDCAIDRIKTNNVSC